MKNKTMRNDEFLDRAMKKRLPPKEVFIFFFVLAAIVGMYQHLTEPHEPPAEPPAVHVDAHHTTGDPRERTTRTAQPNRQPIRASDTDTTGEPHRTEKHPCKHPYK